MNPVVKVRLKCVVHYSTFFCIGTVRTSEFLSVVNMFSFSSLSGINSGLAVRREHLTLMNS